MNTPWKITFTNPEGEERTTEILWSDATPTVNEVALAIRDNLLGDIVLPIDQPRITPNHTVLLLKHHGYEITKIERA